MYMYMYMHIYVLLGIYMYVYVHVHVLQYTVDTVCIMWDNVEQQALALLTQNGFPI